MPVNPIPEGFRTITPYLHVEGLQNLMGFLTHAFGAKQISISKTTNGSIANACMQIGNAYIEMSEVQEGFRPMPCAIHLFVEDADAVYKKAVEVGALSVMEPTTQFYGDREAFVIDPSGNHWYIATRIENIPEYEMQQRMEAFVKKMNSEDAMNNE